MSVFKFKNLIVVIVVFHQCCGYAVGIQLISQCDNSQFILDFREIQEHNRMNGNRRVDLEGRLGFPAIFVCELIGIEDKCSFRWDHSYADFQQAVGIFIVFSITFGGHSLFVKGII